MKKLFYCLALSLGLVSCIQSEDPNSEADIEICTVIEDSDSPSGSILIRDPMIDNNRITLLTRVDADLSQVKLEFTLTPGATINPASGTVRDFSSPQTYVVSSEDGKWKKTYTVSCNTNEMQDKFDFENCDLTLSGKYTYYEFYEEVDGEKQNIWASGNKAAVSYLGSKGPDVFPTVHYDGGKTGKCAKLETVTTGAMGALVGMRIAAGNLFLGEFISAEVLKNPLGATHFGIPFTQAPKRMTGYYKYKTGAKLIDKAGNEMVGQRDSLDIYAVFFEVDDDVKYLDGSNSLTSPNIISLARIAKEDKKEVEELTDEWVYFDIPFVLQPGKEIDPQKLADHQYSISLVFTSSIKGASFCGAVGSTLLVDEVRLIHVNSEDYINE